jgi:[ribosomal protein S18]-alanine N-acetyltransferase
MKLKPKIDIRWMIRRDLFDVVQIELRSHEYPWTEEDFLTVLRQRECIGMVAEHAHEIAGFMIYELHKSWLRLLNFAVEPAYRRNGVGTAMLERMKEKLSQQRRHAIALAVRESSLSAQLFFKSQGFRSACVVRGHYEDTGEDAYEMVFALPDSDAAFVPENRISNFS